MNKNPSTENFWSWMSIFEPWYSLALMSRILIVDWDIHHGQATQHHFENDPQFAFLCYNPFVQYNVHL